jgi:hypothetical protein
LTTSELLAALRARGAKMKIEGDRLTFRLPLGALPDALKAEATAQRAELLALLRPPAPPPGVRLFLETADGKLAWPKECHHWTYERAPTWYYVAQHPLPPHAPALAARSCRRCPSCSGKALRVAWAEIKGGKRQLQCRCRTCGALQGCLKQEPDHFELEWRAA